MMQHALKTRPMSAWQRFFYHRLLAFKTSVQQLSLSYVTTFMTAMVIGLALAFPLGFYVTLKNMEKVATGIHYMPQLSIYLKKTVTKLQQEGIENRLKINRFVKNWRYVSPEEGFKSFQRDNQLGEALKQLQSNPLPGVIIIYPQSNAQSGLQLMQLKSHFSTLSGVDHIQIDQLWISRLTQMIELAHRITWLFIFLFGLGVLLIIWNTIRLITQNFRQSVIVMQLLGARNSFIRRPFLYSGMIYGLLGAIVAWLIVDIVIAILQPPVLKLAMLYHTHFQLQGLSSELILKVVLTGVVLGYIGAFLALRRYLETSRLNLS